MLNLPVRLELEVSPDKTFIAFTIDAVEFAFVPSSGDILIIHYPRWADIETAHVKCILHGCGPVTTTIVMACIKVQDLDSLFTLFDKFKDSVVISDIKTSDLQPPPYYLAYRLIQKLWGSKTYNVNTDLPQVLGTLIRAALQSVGKEDTLPIEILHNIIIGYKAKTYETVELIRIMRDWDAHAGCAKVVAAANEQQTIKIARALFERLRSITTDQLPVGFR